MVVGSSMNIIEPRPCFSTPLFGSAARHSARAHGGRALQRLLRAKLQLCSYFRRLREDEMADGTSAESEALKLAFGYLARSINADSLLSDAFSSDLITEHERAGCFAETNPYKKAEIFLGHLQRQVHGDKNKFHSFVQLLNSSAGSVNLATHLRGW